MKWIQARTGTAKIMLAALGVLFIGWLALGLLVNAFVFSFTRPLPYLVGLLLGHLLSALRLLLMDKSIEKAVDLEGGQAKNYAGLQVTLRYFLTIGFLVAAVLFPRVIGIVGVVLGILSLQFSAYIANAVLSKRGDLL